MPSEKLLKQGVAALKAGRKGEARDLLTQVVEQDERNEMAWLWLSGAVETDEERRTCLENVLAINPNNGVAQRGLEDLKKKSPALFSDSRQAETSLQQIGEPKPEPEAPTRAPTPGKEQDEGPLKQAIAAIEAGEKEKGKGLLVDVLEQDEENEAAWLWMTRCVDDREIKRECFERVLQINPANTKAQKALDKLTTGIKPQAVQSHLGSIEPTQESSKPIGSEVDRSLEYPPPEGRSVKSAVQPEATKTCPYCAEIIKAEAIVCRYCDRDLRISPDPPPQVSATVTQSEEKVKNLTGGDVFLAFALPILGLIVAVFYLLNPKNRKRGFLLIVVSLIAWAVWWVVCSLTGSFSAGY